MYESNEVQVIAAFDARVRAYVGVFDTRKPACNFRVMLGPVWRATIPVLNLNVDQIRTFTMKLFDKRRMTFPLRLALSLKESAHELAQQDGISLNHFISLAVAEKISRLEGEALSEHNYAGRQNKLTLAVGSMHKTVYR